MNKTLEEFRFVCTIQAIVSTLLASSLAYFIASLVFKIEYTANDIMIGNILIAIIIIVVALFIWVGKASQILHKDETGGKE